MRILAMLICGAALLALPVSAAHVQHGAPPAGCPRVKPHTGNTSRDWEAVFGRRNRRSRAVALLNRVRGKGFRCAVIEREQKTYEVAVIGLASRSAALRIVGRAERARLAASVHQS